MKYIVFLWFIVAISWVVFLVGLDTQRVFRINQGCYMATDANKMFDWNDNGTKRIAYLTYLVCNEPLPK